MTADDAPCISVRPITVRPSGIAAIASMQISWNGARIKKPRTRWMNDFAGAQGISPSVGKDSLISLKSHEEPSWAAQFKECLGRDRNWPVCLFCNERDSRGMIISAGLMLELDQG